jgi:4-hydroxyphenylpyruvate dioxygenase
VALAWGRFVNTYDHSWRIVRRANREALGICLDSFHVLSRGSDLTAIRVIPVDKVFFLQLADAPHLHMDVLQWSRHHRLFPGQGVFDLTEFVGAVLATGYTGPLSLEVFNDVFRQTEPRRTAAVAMRSLLALRESLGTHRSAAVRERALGSELPAAPSLDGYAFAEIAGDTGAVVKTLSALGFAQVGQHRFTPLQLWQQGDARILLGSDAPAGARVSGLGVTSVDPGEVRASRRNSCSSPPWSAATCRRFQRLTGPPSRSAATT